MFYYRYCSAIRATSTSEPSTCLFIKTLSTKELNGDSPLLPTPWGVFYLLKFTARKGVAKTAWRCSNFTVRVWQFVRNIHKFAYQHPYYTFIKYLYIIQITDAIAPLWRFFPWLNITCLIKYIYKSQSYWLGWSKDPGPPKAGMFPAIFIVGDASWRN